MGAVSGSELVILTVDQIVQNIVNQLRLLDPTVSAEIGTPERKLIEAMAEVIASSQVDFSVLNEQHNLQSLSGGRLDSYLSIFNFGRQQATPSVGSVTFTRSNANNTAILIPRGTQLQANIDNSAFPSLTFITTDTAVLQGNATSVSVTVQCSTAGSIGNIDSKKIVGFAGLKSIIGISSVTNAQAMTGGQDLETDAEYKIRFQNTLFRNISGTYDSFLALVLSANSVTTASVIGPISRYQEYIQIPSTDDVAQQATYDTAGTTFPHKRTSAKSTIPYSKYTYPVNTYLTSGTLDPATASFFRPGVDFIFNAPPVIASSGAAQTLDNSTPYTPNITFLNAKSVANPSGNPSLVEGSVVLLEHAYMSKNSRNDQSFGILNAIDIFVNGGFSASADSVEVVPSSSNNLQNTNTTLWTYQKLTATVVINYKRKLDGKSAAVGNRLQSFYWQPALSAPNSIQVGTATYYAANYYNPGDLTYYNQFDGTTYTKKAHYILVEEVNGNYGTVRARNGIEWFLAGTNYLNGELTTDVAGAYSGPKIDAQAGTQFTLSSYLYDQNISDLQAIVEKNKQGSQDPLVHRARYRYFRPIVTVMYTIGATKTVVDAAIITALSTYFNNQYFGSAIQLSDILQVIHNVPGVDNVRFTNADPLTGNKVEEVNADGSSFSSGSVFYVTDFYIQDSELAASPTASQVTITVRAANTWGT